VRKRPPYFVHVLRTPLGTHALFLKYMYPEMHEEHTPSFLKILRNPLKNALFIVGTVSYASPPCRNVQPTVSPEPSWFNLFGPQIACTVYINPAEGRISEGERPVTSQTVLYRGYLAQKKRPPPHVGPP